MEKNIESQHLDSVLYQVSCIGMCITDPWAPARCKDISEKLGIPICTVRRCMQKLLADNLVSRTPKHRDGFVITKKGEESDAHKRACQDEASLRVECFGGTEEEWLAHLQSRLNPY